MKEPILASVDAGNLRSQGVVMLNTPKTAEVSSVRCFYTGDTLGLSDMEMQVKTALWEGVEYAYGDGILATARRGLARHTGDGRYGNEFHQFLVAVTLAEAGVKDGEIDLVVFVPPGLYSEKRSYVKSQFLQREVTIQLSGDKRPRRWVYQSVTVLPEGVAALGAFLYDANGDMVPSDFFDGTIAFADYGGYTVDTMRVVNGLLDLDQIQYSSEKNAGVDAHIRVPLLEMIHRHGGTDHLTVDDVDALLRRATLQGTYEMPGVGNMQNVVEGLFAAYARWTADNILDRKLGGGRGLRGVLNVGGGASIVTPYHKEWYGKLMLDPAKLPHTKRVPLSHLNAVGGLRMLLHRRRQG